MSPVVAAATGQTDPPAPAWQLLAALLLRSDSGDLYSSSPFGPIPSFGVALRPCTDVLQLQPHIRSFTCRGLQSRKVGWWMLVRRLQPPWCVVHAPRVQHADYECPSCAAARSLTGAFAAVVVTRLLYDASLKSSSKSETWGLYMLLQAHDQLTLLCSTACRNWYQGEDSELDGAWSS